MKHKGGLKRYGGKVDDLSYGFDPNEQEPPKHTAVDDQIYATNYAVKGRGGTTWKEWMRYERNRQHNDRAQRVIERRKTGS